MLAAPAAAASSQPLLLNVYGLTFQFTSFECPDPAAPLVCDASAVGGVLSNLSTTPGTVDYALVIDFSPAFGSPCNVVDETAVFTFDAGTITVHSRHRDCPATIQPGPRIDTDFVAVSGTGDFAGATGSGTEIGSGKAAKDSSIIYHGTIAL